MFDNIYYSNDQLGLHSEVLKVVKFIILVKVEIIGFKKTFEEFEKSIQTFTCGKAKQKY